MQSSLTDADRDHSLVGFFDSPKRFNVAITRAMTLLVVVGHPRMLKHDSHWHALVRPATPACYTSGQALTHL